MGQRYDSKEVIEWTDTHQSIMDDMINYLKSPEVIKYQNFDQPFFSLVMHLRRDWVQCYIRIKREWIE